MGRFVYSSIEDMTYPTTLGNLVQRRISKTCLAPFETEGWSTTEAEFVGVDECNGKDPRYIIKRIRQELDWVMQATEDHHWRAITIWQHGLLDLMPEEINHATIACTRDETGYAILMHNVSPTLLQQDRPISAENHALILDAMAALHAAFFEDDLLGDPKLNLCKPEDFFSHTSPEKAKRIRETNPSFVLDMIIEGRRLMTQLVDTDMAKLVHDMVHDPTPFCAALANYPQTITHTDVRPANLGVEHGERSRLIMLDWARPTPTVPAVDLVYYLIMNSSANLPITFEESIDLYKVGLASRLGNRFQESWWQPQLELALFGVFAEAGIFKAWFAEHSDDVVKRKQDRADLDWWADQARMGAKRLTSS
jgi:hypothetical protein